MQLFETATCSTLPVIDPDLVQAIESADRNPDSHRALMRAMDAMHLVEIGGELEPTTPLGASVTVAAWNMQRCFYPEQSAELLLKLSPDVVLVSEMDNGMARTHQRNTTRALANSLGMRYAFGVEFFELGLGNENERRLSADDFNEKGWHGNAVLSRHEPIDVALIRLDSHGHWFCPEESHSSDRVLAQPRVGGRCAIAAILPSKSGNICLVSTHLENNTQGDLRQSQMERLMAALDSFAPELPIIIGGDLNNSNADLATTSQEPLFLAARRRGFSWENNADGPTTRRSPFWTSSRPLRHLDWFCSRGFSAKGAEIVPALDESGKVLSDHELILGHFEHT